MVACCSPVDVLCVRGASTGAGAGATQGAQVPGVGFGLTAAGLVGFPHCAQGEFLFCPNRTGELAKATAKAGPKKKIFADRSGHNLLSLLCVATGAVPSGPPELTLRLF